MDFKKDLDFILLLEEMKKIERMTRVLGTNRRENDAEHSWHVAIMSLILRKYSKEEIDIDHVIKMILVHDLVEIYAGDTFAYDTQANIDKRQREEEAMIRLQSQVSQPFSDMLGMLWQEFEKMQTKEAKYANAMDRLQPIMLNLAHDNGGTWASHSVTYDQVLKRIEPIAYVNDDIYNFILEKINIARDNGFIA